MRHGLIASATLLFLLALASPGEAAVSSLSLPGGDQLFCGFHDAPALVDDDGERKIAIRQCPFSRNKTLSASVDHSCCLKQGAPRTLVEMGGGLLVTQLRPETFLSLQSESCGAAPGKNDPRYSSLTLTLDTPPPQL